MPTFYDWAAAWFDVQADPTGDTMLTPTDLEASNTKSGYKHVLRDDGKRVDGHGSRSVAYQGDRGPKSPAGKRYFPRRKTALEAAQDYCDWKNNQPALTIDDIRNPRRKSGFNHVSYIVDKRRASDAVPFRAVRRTGPGKGAGVFWYGKRRATAEEAAQDYCDYINAQSAPRVAASLKWAGHATRPGTPTEKERHVKRAEKRPVNPKGFIYLVAESAEAPMNQFAVKIGRSKDDPKYRLSELQTGNPRKLTLLGSFSTEDQVGSEAALHAKYIKDNVLGEWFTPSVPLLAEFGLVEKKEA